MEDHQKRVVEEKEDLDGKIVRLRRFEDSITFKDLDADEQGRLEEQYAVMQEYSRILDRRIGAF